MVESLESQYERGFCPQHSNLSSLLRLGLGNILPKSLFLRAACLNQWASGAKLL